jgi:preprotein translocase subunit SecB
MGGFPPLMMELVDFCALYLQNLRNLRHSRQRQRCRAVHADQRQAQN